MSDVRVAARYAKSLLELADEPGKIEEEAVFTTM